MRLFGFLSNLPRMEKPPIPIVPVKLFWPANDATIGVVVGSPLDTAKLAGLPREEVLTRLRQELEKVCAEAKRLRRTNTSYRSL